MKSKTNTTVEKLVPILKRFMEEYKVISADIIRKGAISKDVCARCNSGNRRDYVKLADSEKVNLKSFIGWIKRDRIEDYSLDSGGFAKIVSNNKLKGFGRRLSTPENIPYLYVQVVERYCYNVEPDVQRKKKLKNIFSNFPHGFTFCSHMNREMNINTLFDNAVKLRRYIEYEYTSGMSGLYGATRHTTSNETTSYLCFCCESCRERMDKFGCESGISKRGFVYVASGCSWVRPLLLKILDEESISYEEGEMRYRGEMGELFLREYNTLIGDIGGDTINIIKPNLTVIFDGKQKIIDYLAYDTNLLIISENEFYYYDKDRPIEKKLDEIVSKIAKCLSVYVDEMRGSDHDRIIGSVIKIGEELGFLPQKEYGKKGSIVDCVWYDRGGNPHTVIEVETTGGWKKDLVSTWELEPELAVIITHYKTDKIVEYLIQYALLKVIPHKLLYINMTTKKGYLFNKQQLLHIYSIRTMEEQEFTLKEV